MADTDLTPFPRNAYSRRSVVAGIAAALPAAAIAAAPALASPSLGDVSFPDLVDQFAAFIRAGAIGVREPASCSGSTRDWKLQLACR